MSNVNDVISALKPLLLVTECFGFTSITLPTKQLSRKCVIWELVDFYQFSLIVSVTEYINIFFDFLNLFCGVTWSWIFYKNILEIIVSLSDFDQKLLGLNLTFLNLNEECKKIKVKFMTIFLLLIPYLLGFTLHGMLYFSTKIKIISFTMKWIYLFYCHASVFNDLQIWGFIYLVKQRFKWLNIELLTIGKLNQSIMLQRSIEESNLSLRSIKVIGDLHWKLWIICQKINKTYSFQITTLILRSFFNIMNMIFYIVTNLFSDTILPAREYIYYFNSVSVYILGPLLITLVSSQASTEANELGNTMLNIHSASLKNADADLDCICILLQLLHTKVKFTASGLFQVNTSLLYMVFSSIVTYSIIVLQFDVGFKTKMIDK